MRFLVILWRTAPLGNLFFNNISKHVLQQNPCICFSTKFRYMCFNNIWVFVFQQNPGMCFSTKTQVIVFQQHSWRFWRMEFRNSGSAPKSLDILANGIWDFWIFENIRWVGVWLRGVLSLIPEHCMHLRFPVYSRNSQSLFPHQVQGISWDGDPSEQHSSALILKLR